MDLDKYIYWDEKTTIKILVATVVLFMVLTVMFAFFFKSEQTAFVDLCQSKCGEYFTTDGLHCKCFEHLNSTDVINILYGIQNKSNST